MKQHGVGDACGTIAVVHSIANNLGAITFGTTFSSSILLSYFRNSDYIIYREWLFKRVH